MATQKKFRSSISRMYVLLLYVCMFFLCLFPVIGVYGQQDSYNTVDDANQELRKIRQPDVVFVPTPQEVVDEMLKLAKVTKDDLVYDLGCGDGRIVVTAAKNYDCKCIGYDINPDRIIESLENVKQNKVQNLVRIEQKDIFSLDLTDASVITLYLLPSLNVKLIPQLDKLKAGTRIVSHDFDMQGLIPPDKSVIVTTDDDRTHDVYLWITPLKRNKSSN